MTNWIHFGDKVITFDVRSNCCRLENLRIKEFRIPMSLKIKTSGNQITRLKDCNYVSGDFCFIPSIFKSICQGDIEMSGKISKRMINVRIIEIHSSDNEHKNIICGKWIRKIDFSVFSKRKNYCFLRTAMESCQDDKIMLAMMKVSKDDIYLNKLILEGRMSNLKCQKFFSYLEMPVYYNDGSNFNILRMNSMSRKSKTFVYKENGVITKFNGSIKNQKKQSENYFSYREFYVHSTLTPNLKISKRNKEISMIYDLLNILENLIFEGDFLRKEIFGKPPLLFENKNIFELELIYNELIVIYEGFQNPNVRKVKVVNSDLFKKMNLIQSSIMTDYENEQLMIFDIFLEKRSELKLRLINFEKNFFVLLNREEKEMRRLREEKEV